MLLALCVRGIQRWLLDSPHKGQWRGDLMFSFICAWTKHWANSPDAGDLRRHIAHYDVTTILWCRLTNGEILIINIIWSPNRLILIFGISTHGKKVFPLKQGVDGEGLQCLRNGGETLNWCTKTETKWTSFCRRHFPTNFLKWKILYFLLKFCLRFPKDPIDSK